MCEEALVCEGQVCACMHGLLAFLPCLQLEM